jgi:hypothetical protein
MATLARWHSGSSTPSIPLNFKKQESATTPLKSSRGKNLSKGGWSFNMLYVWDWQEYPSTPNKTGLMAPFD